MSSRRTAILTTLAMTAFAGNSLLCRMALKGSGISAAGFTFIRLVSGATVLWAITSLSGRRDKGSGDWLSALALFAYAAGFSFAYLTLTAATGALLLFGAVQATMIGHGIRAGERLQRMQLIGLVLASAGLVFLLLPGLSAPPLAGSLLMLLAGVAWGLYSLRGKGARDPLPVTAGNFLRATVLAVPLCLLTCQGASFDTDGVLLAIASGAVASGLGYAVWYSVLPSLSSTGAAAVQLTVPVMAALAGIAFLGEPLTVRFLVASIAILCGITPVILRKPR